MQDFTATNEFADSMTAEFQEICGIELTADDLETTQSDRELRISFTMSHDPNTRPTLGEFTPKIGEMLATLKIECAEHFGVSPEALNMDFVPTPCDDGIVVTILFRVQD